MPMTAARNDTSGLMTGLAIALALLAPFLIYFDTARSIVAIWNSSETFAHGYIILPISLWLIWGRRKTLAKMPPAPYWPGLLLLAACGFGWLLAELGNVQVVRQYAFVAMIPAAAIAVLGLRISWSIAFPLCFLLLAVPFGEIFIDPLINFTADFTVAALQATGIPVLREGTTFSIPSGNWSVVEACSGVRYLIASFTLGCLYAYLTYRSHVRQLMFVLLAIIVPIIANGIRAYMIVMIGHLSGMKLAVGVDHLIYGWIFFGLVMFLMFWIGSYWREDQDEVAAPATTSDTAGTADKAASPARIFAAALSAVACIGIWPIYANHIERAGFNPEPVELASFQSQWPEAAPFTTWKPAFNPASAELNRYFQHDSKQVGVTLKYYRNQHRGSELVSTTNRLLAEQENSVWQQTGTSLRHETISDRTLVLRETRIHGETGSLLVWHWYWIDGKFTANDYLAKLFQVKEKFLMRGDDGAAMMVFAPYDANPDTARALMRDFLTANLAGLEAALANNKKP